MLFIERITAAARMAAVAGLLVVLTGETAAAQYFGRNKVRYDEFEFKVLKTEHFDIYYYQQERRAIDEAARLAERWYARLSEVLEYRFVQRQPLILYANHADFEQTTVIPGFIGESTGGVTEALRNRIVMPFTASLANTSHVLGHELVHAFQFDMTGGRALRLPLWFVEGMAEYLSLGPVHAHTALWLRDAAIREELPGFEELDNPAFFPYRFGHAAWAYVAGRWGDSAVREVFLAAAQTGDPLRALEAIAKVDIETLSAAWHESVYATYRNLATADLSPRGRPLITQEREGGRVNVGPALSPNGERIIYFSEKELFSIEMFLADARTGETIRKLTELATDPHFDSIQWLESSGAWAPDSRRFVHATQKGGQSVFVILDTETGDRLRQIELPRLGQVLNPTWSPDGRYIAFSGLRGGISDLYIYDLEANTMDRATNDLYTQIQPKWSPDGRSIVLVTDQFSTELATLSFGNYRLGLYDVASRRISPLRGFDDAKNINPQWAPDGRSIYFLADPNGIPNVFRLALATGAISALTSVATGVTGITETSPALDVATGSGRIAFTLFNEGNYGIYVLDDQATNGEVQLPRVNAAVLPPPDRVSSPISNLLAAPRVGLPARQDFPITDYDPDLGLLYVGAAATTGFGAFAPSQSVGGGVAFQFADILNFHQVTAVVEANRGVRDIGGQISYLNQSTRWNYGAAFQYFPYVSGSFSQGLAQVDGRTVIVERERIFRQTNREILGVTDYPFNRASRVEFTAGLRSIAFDREDTTRLFSAQTGQFLDEDVVELDAPSTLNLARASAAYVYDTSVFGATAPVLGTRARFEATPTFGGLTFTEVLADARHYVVPARPFTLAGRVLHFGRYGSDGEDNRLTPLFLGYPALVRGYSLESFSADECFVDGTSECPVIDRLLGSRLFVAKAELRFPIVGLFQGEFNYGPIPVEAFVFGDTGIAWTSDNEPSFLAGDRQFVSSAGAGFRVNALGYVVLEFAGVKPFDRVDDGWRFEFNIVPGF